MNGRRAVFGIGVFDGVHRGHRKLLDEVVRLAKETDALPAAVTFAPHPRQVLNPGNPVRLLLPPGERINLLRHAGMASVSVIPFTRALAALPPMEFLEMLADFPGELCGICVGANWRFGAGASGGIAELEKFAAVRKIRFCPVPELVLGARTVSSTEIRRAVASGRLNDAREMLGRPYRLTGTVVHGYRDATGDLDCPTANLLPDEGILPPDGVYAGRAFAPDGQSYPAAVNLGFSPTYRRPDGERRLELHLLDFQGDLYGKTLGLEFIRCLRPERTFPDTGALKRQIQTDLADIRKLQETT